MRRMLPWDVIGVVAAGGAAGTLLRAFVAQEWPTGSTGFPWATLVVNLFGSLVLGFAIVTAVDRLGPTRWFRPLVGTGFCGGLTTFSTFAVEIDLLVRAGAWGTAASYLAVSVVAGLAAARVGVVGARRLWQREVA